MSHVHLTKRAQSVQTNFSQHPKVDWSEVHSMHVYHMSTSKALYVYTLQCAFTCAHVWTTLIPGVLSAMDIRTTYIVNYYCLNCLCVVYYSTQCKLFKCVLFTSPVQTVLLLAGTYVVIATMYI